MDDIQESDINNDNTFYADDVQAQAIRDSNLDPDSLVEDDDVPVTSGEMEIGDLDIDSGDTGEGESYDEEMTPAGDNVIS